MVEIKGKYYTTGCLLDYEYIKTWKIIVLIAFDLSGLKELDVNPKAIQKI